MKYQKFKELWKKPDQELRWHTHGLQVLAADLSLLEKMTSQEKKL